MKKKKFLYKLNQTILPFIFIGVLIGILSGLIIFFYNIAADQIMHWGFHIYELVRNDPAYIPLLVLGVAVLALTAGQMIKYFPDIRGGGVPFTEGMTRGKLTINWILAIPTMAVSSFISIFMGLTLGCEGPSIFIGANSGYGMSRMLKRRNMENRIFATAGACAGLGVAFNTPLAGVFFALEEAHRKFSAQIIAPAVAAVASGLLTKKLLAEFFPKLNIGDFLSTAFLPGFEDISVRANTPHIICSIIIGVICGLAGCLFTYAATKKIPKIDKIKPQYRVLIPAVGVVLIGIFLPVALGAGKNILLEIGSISLGMLALILVVKFVFIIVCSRSWASGGIFVPMLTLGAMTGAIFSNLFNLMGFQTDIMFMAIIGAVSFFAAAVRAPLTSIILAFEITRFNLQGIICALVGVLCAYGVAEFLKVRPLYDALLDRILESKQKAEKEELRTLSFVVDEHSYGCGRQLRDIVLPDNTIVSKLTRNGVTFVPEGDTVIEANDILLVHCQVSAMIEDEKEFNRIFVLD